MRTLEIIKTGIVILIISFAVGCSDQLTSSGNANVITDPKINKEVVSEIKGSTIDVFRTQVRLKPYRTYRFNSSNTPYSVLNTIDVETILSPDIDKLVKDCEDILIYQSNGDKKKSYGCHAKGFVASELIIQNQGSGFLDLTVVLTGVKKSMVVDTE
ncbi:MAG: hypothetical protein ABI528_01030 [bacterium]